MTPSGRGIWRSTAASAWAEPVLRDPTIGRRCCRRLLHPAPHRALFLGIGTGATLVGGSQMPGVRCTASSLSREVVELLPWFARSQRAGLRDAIAVTVADARRSSPRTPRQYDVIIADLFHPALDGSGALYTTEHFAAVRRRLAPGGVFCQWLPLYQLDLPSLRAIIRGFLEIYPGGSAWLNHYSVPHADARLDRSRAMAAPSDLDALAARLRQTRRLDSSRAADRVRDTDGFARAISRRSARPVRLAGEGPRNTGRLSLRDIRCEPQRCSADGAAMGPAARRHAGVATRIRPSSWPSQSARIAARAGRAYWRARNRFLEAGAALPGDPRGSCLDRGGVSRAARCASSQLGVRSCL